MNENTHYVYWGTSKTPIFGYLVKPSPKESKKIKYWFTAKKLATMYPLIKKPGFGFTKDWVHYHSSGTRVKIFRITKLFQLFYETSC